MTRSYRRSLCLNDDRPNKSWVANLQGFVGLVWKVGDSPKQESRSHDFFGKMKQIISFFGKICVYINIYIYVYIHTFFCLIRQNLCFSGELGPLQAVEGKHNPLRSSNHAAGIREARKTKTGRRASNLGCV